MNAHQAYLFLSLALYPGVMSLLTGYDPNNLPKQSDPSGRQYGYNQCGTKAHPDSKCQNLFINSAEDFCVYAPPTPRKVGDSERITVSYCSKDGHGSRLIPPGTFRNLHYVHTPHYVQITALGDFTKMNIPAGDQGGELDPSGPDGYGNPVGGLVFGPRGQFDRWTEFIAHDELCFRACYNTTEAYRYCEHIYDIEGCRWNMPGNYEGTGFDECEGTDVPLPMGEYRGRNGKIYKWHRGDTPTTPPPGAPGKIKSCRSVRPPGLAYPKSAKRSTWDQMVSTSAMANLF